MTNFIVFDIETYRSDWQVQQPRREAFDPTKNAIIAIGTNDGKNVTVFPVVEDLREEKTLVRHFFKKLQEFEDSILVGYNILHFDIPYVVQKLNLIGQQIDMSRFRPLDLYWILPYWLQNSPKGKELGNSLLHLGRLWKFEDVVRHILRREANPFSNKDVFRLWETKRFGDIEKHLERDLADTYSLLELPAIKETMEETRKLVSGKEHCEESCPFKRPLQKTPEKANYYCTLLQHNVSNETMLKAVDVIDFPLPRRGVSWTPLCRK
jgi:DNA polymerase elongation subunit (family B)